MGAVTDGDGLRSRIHTWEPSRIAGSSTVRFDREQTVIHLLAEICAVELLGL
jgi:hypothetical protein